MSFIETDFLNINTEVIAGVDEVGRGPLAGPVVAGCAKYFVSDNLLKDFKKLRDLGVTDSKKLSISKRERILKELKLRVIKSKQTLFNGRLEICLSEVTHQKIDKINILQASLYAMKSSFKKLSLGERSILLIDGNKSFSVSANVETHTLIKGDEKSVLIGLSSILAKSYRDQSMQKYSKLYPHYDFEKNAGYPTQKHREAIRVYGITPIHRKSFKGVKEYVEL